MKANDPPNETPEADDPTPTRLDESSTGSGTPARFGDVRRRTPGLPTIPDHEILRVIGQGAYGEVWLARNIMGVHRAVKIVYRNSFDSDRPYEREFAGIQSFEPISRSHESQVDILHVGRNESERYFYYVMELADDVQTGREIAPDSYKPKTIHSELKRRGRFAYAETLEICLALTTAVEHLHKHGLIHRDIKPSNVIFLNGRPKLADIGLVTETGGTMSFVGTEGYLPPEGPGSVQADIYSLGKTLYEVATGRDRMEFPELPTLTEAPNDEAGLFELNEVLIKACHPDPQQRYRTASEMHADLVLLQAGKSVRRSRAVERRLALLTRVSVAGAVLTSLLVAGYLYQQFQTREARRLADENRELASREGAQRRRAEALLSTLQLKEAEHLFERDDANNGVAYLARMLRQNSSNQIAAARLVSALNDRSFALPIRDYEFAEMLEDLEFSQDGSRFVAWTRTNGVARLWEVASGRMIGQPMSHTLRDVGSRFSPDGRWIATVSTNNTVRFWNGRDAEPVGLPCSHDAGINDLRFSPDSQRLLVASGTKAYVWTVPDAGRVLPPLGIGSDLVAFVRFSPDGRWILTGSPVPRADLWDAQTGAHVRNLEMDGLERGWLGSVQFSPNGRQIAAASNVGLVLWDAESGRIQHRLRHDAGIFEADFSPDGLRLVTGDDQDWVRVWDTQTGQPLIQPIKARGIWALKFDPTGERLVTCENGRARLWDARTGRPLTEWIGNAWRAHFSPDGRHVLVHEHSRGALRDARIGRAFNLVLHQPTGVSAAEFSASGRRVVAASADLAIVWDPETGKLAGPQVRLPARMTTLEFSPDEQTIVVASVNGQAQVWDARTGALVNPAMRHEAAVVSARVSPDGRKIVTGSWDGAVRFWDATNGQPLTDPLMISNHVESLEFSPDGNRVLIVPRPNAAVFQAVGIWSLISKEWTPLAAQKNLRLFDAHFSPDGTRVVGARLDPPVASIWDAMTGEMVGEPLRHQLPVRTARYSPDGRRIVTSSSDKTARVWNATTFQPIGEPMRHEDIIGAGFSHDSRRVVTYSGTDHTTRVWDAETGRPLTERLRHEDRVTVGKFSPDDHRVLTASLDGTVRLWDLPPSEVPVPGWLLDLAEAIAESRLLENESPESISAETFLALKDQILTSHAEDRHTTWAKWCLSDRMERSVSFASRVPAKDHLAQLLKRGSVATLREAIQFAPDNAEATARLARQVLAEEHKDYPHKEQVAAFLADRAMKLDPHEPEAWRAKAEVLAQTGRLDEALKAIEQAIAIEPGAGELWNLKGQWLESAARDNDALAAYSTAVASSATNILTLALLNRARILAKLGQSKEAADDNLRARGIPSRDPLAKPAQADLSGHYNLALSDDPGAPGTLDGRGKSDFGSLPYGLQFIAGVQFDVRGSVRVGHLGNLGIKIPSKVEGITLNQRCRQLHFLHSAVVSTSDRDGAELGRYVVHYEDGQKAAIPIVLGKTIQDLHYGSDGQAVRAWQGVNEVGIWLGRPCRAFKQSWPNPRPEVRIVSLDLEHAPHTNAPPALELVVLLAVTALSEPTPAISCQPTSQSVAGGQPVTFQVEARSESPLAFQWQFNGVDIPGATDPIFAIKSAKRGDAGAYTVRVQNAVAGSVLALTSESAQLVVESDGCSYGTLRRETFTNVSGRKLQDLTNHTRFPAQPDGVDFVHQFEAPSNFAENYGVRLAGYVMPPKTGEYRFYLCSDDEGALFLSTAGSPEHKRRIAHEPEWNGARLWTIAKSRPRRENVSGPIHLEAGRHYYIEALMKEGLREDNLGVAWQMPGEPPPENFAPPIPGTYLAVPTEWLKPVVTAKGPELPPGSE